MLGRPRHGDKLRAMLARLALLCSALTLFGALGACSSTGIDSSSNANNNEAGQAGSAGAPDDNEEELGGASGSSGASGSGGGDIDVGGTAGSSALPDISYIYAHSENHLYRLDPQTNAVSDVGVFTCTSLMWDLALDKDNVMYGTTSNSLVAIDPETAKCQNIAVGDGYPNSLTFVPAGVLDASEEVLVGYNVSTYVKIDKKTGQKTDIGSLNPNPTGTDWVSSGDIVSIIGGKTYLTAKPFWEFEPKADTLLEVDPKTGQALKVIGKVVLTDVWGLAFWGGRIYGFAEDGRAVELDLNSGKAKLLTDLPFGLSFWGAGVTTAAPLVPIN